MTLWHLELVRLTRTCRWTIVFGTYGLFGIFGPVTGRYLGEILGHFGGEMNVFIPEPTPADGIAPVHRERLPPGPAGRARDRQRRPGARRPFRVGGILPYSRGPRARIAAPPVCRRDAHGHARAHRRHGHGVDADRGPHRPAAVAARGGRHRTRRDPPRVCGRHARGGVRPDHQRRKRSPLSRSASWRSFPSSVSCRPSSRGCRASSSRPSSFCSRGPRLATSAAPPRQRRWQALACSRSRSASTSVGSCDALTRRRGVVGPLRRRDTQRPIPAHPWPAEPRRGGGC